MAHLSAFWLPLSVSIATATIPFTPSFLSHWFFCNHIPLTSLILFYNKTLLPIFNKSFFLYKRMRPPKGLFLFLFSWFFSLFFHFLGLLCNIIHSLNLRGSFQEQCMHDKFYSYEYFFCPSIKHWETKGLQWLCTLLLVSFGVWNVEQTKRITNN